MSQAKESAVEAAPAAERPATAAVVAKPAAIVSKPAAVTKPKAAPVRGEVVNLPPGAESRTAPPARPKARHRLALWSYVVAVALPASAIAAYLYGVAADQYASRTSFSIRGAESVGPVSFLGALSQTVTVGGTDAEIVYEFVRSQQMVEAAAAALPLERLYNLPDRDVVFRLGEGRPIEDVRDYWNRMTSVSFDGASGIVHFEARAFDSESARFIAQFVLDESTRIVNGMSAQAREDAVAVAREVLGDAEDRLRAARRSIRAFRDAEQELDPTVNAEAALGLMAGLRQQLANAQVELDSYLALVGPRGPRAAALRQRIDSLERRIATERQRLGAGEGTGLAPGVAGDGGRLFSALMGDYEELILELEFAQNAYTSALAAFEQAQVEARRQSRFLAPHIRPTLSVAAEYPQRALIAAAAFLLLSVAWAVLLLIAYNIRDRR
ncbi:capsule biosynthesis protein [Rubrimonas sp.]|uniref:capsule biosynthesis protein n=1 Tax=Rubrimonas sp. TaxID=2036015 RepID=UPI002FDD7499